MYLLRLAFGWDYRGKCIRFNISTREITLQGSAKTNLPGLAIWCNTGRKDNGICSTKTQEGSARFVPVCITIGLNFCSKSTQTIIESGLTYRVEASISYFVGLKTKLFSSPPRTTLVASANLTLPTVGMRGLLADASRMFFHSARVFPLIVSVRDLLLQLRFMLRVLRG